MKKIISGILALTLTIGCSLPSFAAESKSPEKSQNLNLIEYLEENPVTTEEEFLNIITEHGNDLAISSISNEPKESSNDSTEEFSYFIDEENQMVYTQTLKTSDEVPVTTESRTSRTIWQRKATTEYKGYSVIGIHIYTVTTEGTFQYDKQSYCKAVKSNGYFNPAFLSLWQASAWISDGNYTTSKAYVETYGTANLNLAIAEIIGITVNFQSINYSLELTCDKMGNCHGYYTLKDK